MTSIGQPNENNSKYNTHSTTNKNVNFDEKVLNYIRENQPDCSLNELLEELKSLSPDAPVTMQKLNASLLYSDGVLRVDPDYKDYTDTTLDKLTTQLLGVNMMFNKMMISVISPPDNEL